MNPDQKIAAFLAKAEVHPAKSKLAPYEEMIRRLRQNRWTYRQIAEALRSDFGVQVNPKSIWAYLHAECRQARASQAPSLIPVAHALPQKPVPRQSARFNLDA